MSVQKSKLLLSKIILNNYRTYLGQNQIEFSMDPEKPITIVHGESGHGKTSLLNSVHWCLYGTERTESSVTDTIEGIVNKTALANLSIGESTDTFVELWIYDDDGAKFHIKRSIIATKESESEKTTYNELNHSEVSAGIRFTTNLLFQYRPDYSNQLETIDHIDTANQQIENFFPQALSSYILFDAELLNQFLNQKEEKLVKDGIEKISGLPILDLVKKHLSKTAEYIESELGEEDVELGTMLERKQELLKNQEKLDYAINEADQKIDKLNIEIEKISEFLIKNSESEVNTKETQLKELERDEKQLQKTFTELNDEIKEFLMETIHKIYLKDTVLEAETKFQQYEDEGKIPPVISKTALDGILNSSPSSCICGRPLSVGSTEREKIEKMKIQIVDSTIIQEITRGRDRLSLILENTTKEKIESGFNKYLERRSIARESLRKIRDSKKEIQKFFERHSREEVRNKGIERDQMNRLRYELSTNLGADKEQLSVIKKLLKDLQSDVDHKSAKNQKNESEKLKIHLCRKIEKIVQDLRDELLDEFKEKTAKSATNYFLKIAPRKEDFAGVKILPTFQIRAIDQNGNHKKLSMGQSHCLGLSYVAAIRNITKQNYFVMIDSPLHNISQKAKAEVAEILPRYLSGTQLTLLVTDQEYTGEAHENIEGGKLRSVRDTLIQNKSLWGEYLLEVQRDEKNNPRTTVRKIGKSG